MEHLGSLNPFTRRDEEDNTGNNVALQNVLAQHADVKPEVHKQVIRDGIKLLRIGTTTQNSLHFIFNDPVKGLFGCLKNYIEKQTMDIPDPKNIVVVVAGERNKAAVLCPPKGNLFRKSGAQHRVESTVSNLSPRRGVTSNAERPHIILQ